MKLLIFISICAGVTGYGMSSPWYLLSLLPLAALAGVGARELSERLKL